MDTERHSPALQAWLGTSAKLYHGAAPCTRSRRSSARAPSSATPSWRR